MGYLAANLPILGAVNDGNDLKDLFNSRASGKSQSLETLSRFFQMLFRYTIICKCVVQCLYVVGIC